MGFTHKLKPCGSNSHRFELNLAPSHVIICYALLFLHASKVLVNIHWTSTALTTKLHSAQCVHRRQDVTPVVFRSLTHPGLADRQE